MFQLTSNISPSNCQALYRTVLSRQIDCVVEIGMAFGVSTLSILTALQEVGRGRLISIDPYYNWRTAEEVAKHQIDRAGFSARHQHLRMPSHRALPELLANGVRADLVYIDGWHTFDYAFIDFFYADKLVDVGDVIVFNDAGWRSVFRVIRFLQTHRKYRELNVGLPRTFPSRNPVFSLVKRLQGRSNCDRYFEKRESWEPPFNYYRRF